MRSRGLIFYAILALLWIYTGYKATQLSSANRWLVWGLASLFFGLMLGYQIWYRSDARAVQSELFNSYAWVGAVCMGFWGTFIMLTLPWDLINVLTYATITVRKTASFDPARRQFFESLSLGIFTASAAITGIGFYQAVRGPKVRRREIPVEALPESLEGLTIVQISDLHVGPTIRQRYVEDVVAQVNALSPDIVAVTGDLADGTPSVLAPHIAPLKNLKARYGVYYVTGNHEYYWGAESWIGTLRAFGWNVLLNENRLIAVGAAKLLIGGITDPTGARFFPSHTPDMARAAASTERVDFKLLLAHRPGVYDAGERAGFDLQLSGHTHSGQFFPWNVIVGMAHKYSRGTHRHQKLWVHVNGGTGYWGPPHRFMIPSEISCLQLMRSEKPPIQLTAKELNPTA